MKRKERTIVWRFAVSVLGATVVAIGTSWDGGAAVAERRLGTERAQVVAGDRGGARLSFRRLEKPADTRVLHWQRMASEGGGVQDLRSHREIAAGRSS